MTRSDNPERRGSTIQAWLRRRVKGGRHRTATNVDINVESIVREHVGTNPTLIVTGYQDFLTAVGMLMTWCPWLAKASPGRIRVIFGTNYDTAKGLRAPDMRLKEEAQQYFLKEKGLNLTNEADLRAFWAYEAIKRGAIELRIYDRDQARAQRGQAMPARLHAKLFAFPDVAITGSANFSHAGLFHQWEHVERVWRQEHPELYAERAGSAEAIWACGIDWTADALAILRGFLHFVTPEQAVARTVADWRKFPPWHAGSVEDTNEPDPLDVQQRVVFDALWTLYEYGFALVEAVPGSGKTNMGIRIAALYSQMRRRTVPPPDQAADQGRRQEQPIVIAPARVAKRWDTPQTHVISMGELSRGEVDVEQVAQQVGASLHDRFRGATLVVLDESHNFISRGQVHQKSKRAQALENAPPVHPLTLSATIQGNHGLDGLAQLQESLASLLMNTGFVTAFNGALRALSDLSAAGTMDPAPAEDGNIGRVIEIHEAQVRMARALSPFVVRLTKACVNNSPDIRAQGRGFPEIEHERYDVRLTETQTRLLAQIDNVISNFVGSSPVHISKAFRFVGTDDPDETTLEAIAARRFKEVLRCSVTAARAAWQDGSYYTDTLKRGGSRAPGQMMLPFTDMASRFEPLLFDPELDRLDTERADRLLAFLIEQGEIACVAETQIVLKATIMQLVERIEVRGLDAEIFLVGSPSDAYGGDATLGWPTFKKTHPKTVRAITEGKKIEHHFAASRSDGTRRTKGKLRAAFLTYSMAEGVNMQRASGMAILGATSNLTHYQQALGRIDRIDTPHRRIRYLTLALPPNLLVFASDRRFQERLRHNYLLAGHTPPSDLDPAEEGMAVSPGEMTRMLIDYLDTPRRLRPEHAPEAVEHLANQLDPGVLDEVRRIDPEAPWGARLALLDPLPGTSTPFTILMLRGVHPFGGAYAPPRLVMRSAEGITRDQTTIVRTLTEAYAETLRRGRHRKPLSAAEIEDLIGDIYAAVTGVRQWDLRPERLVTLLSTLAAFLDGLDDVLSPDNGAGRFGDLPLQALERIAREWTHDLEPYWHDQKRWLGERLQEGVVPGYLDVRDTVRKLRDDAAEVVSAKRTRLEQVIATACDDLADNPEMEIGGRVAVILQVKR